MVMLELTGFYTGERRLVNVDHIQTIGQGNDKQTIICFSRHDGDELSVSESYEVVKSMLPVRAGRYFSE